MNVAMDACRIHPETDKGGINIGSAVVTLQDLGRYLRNLRENKRVTQVSLSTKAGAMAGRKISRSRISEIENAKRDPISERELRMYMVGLKCTPHHIDGLVKALRQFTVTPPRESPADPVPSSSAIPDSYFAELDDAKDNLTPRDEKYKDNLTTTGDEEEGRERWSQEDRLTHFCDAPQPQPSRRRWQRHRIAIAAVTALVFVALTGLGAEFFLRQENANLSTSPGSPAALLGPSNTPLLREETRGFIKNVTSPDPAPVRANQRSTQISKVKDRPRLKDTSTEHRVGHCCVHQGQNHAVDFVSLPSIEPDWHSYLAWARGR
jgi:transcriptional regulator with XRE-family HTH domain